MEELVKALAMFTVNQYEVDTLSEVFEQEADRMDLLNNFDTPNPKLDVITAQLDEAHVRLSKSYLTLSRLLNPLPIDSK